VWIVANYKETQRRTSGQASGDRRRRCARRPRFNARSAVSRAPPAARFSLLPPETPTGNFVKVVQRVPVKIVLDAGQDPEHRLRPGMSVTTTCTHGES